MNTNGYAQDAKIPGKDKARVSRLIELSSEHLDLGEIEKALSYSNSALAISKKWKYQEGIARSFFALGNVYEHNGENALSLKMYKKAEVIYLKIKSYNSLADCQLNMGNVCDNISDYPNALKYYYLALDHAKKLKRTDLLADCYLNIGIQEYSLGDYSKSLKTHYKSLRYYELLKDKPRIADVYNSLGNVYCDQGDKKKALQMYFTSLKLAKETDEKESIANAYVNIGAIYTETGQIGKAIGMFKISLRIFRELNYDIYLALVYNNLAEAYIKAERYEDALSVCDSSLTIAKISRDKAEMVCSYINMGDVYTNQSKFDAAQSAFDKALQLSREIQSKSFIKDTYESMIALDVASNKYKEAFEHQRLFVIYKDSVNNEETERQGIITELEYAYDKRAENERRKNDKAVFKLKTQNKLSKQQQNYLVAILVTLLLSALIVWYFARRAYNDKKRYSEVLSNENEFKEALLQEVHHRVNNSLQMISSLLSIQSDSTESEEIREYLLKSENRIQAMSVMHQLLHLGNSKLEVNMNDYLNEVLDFYTRMLETKKNVRLHSSVPSVLFHTKTAMPLALILNELITNSLKYAFPDDQGQIDISLSENADKTWTFTVTDNGIGFDKEKDPVKQSSIGLELVRLMTRQLNGELTADGSNGMSVQIRFTPGT
jgi:two-component sensor histidine kinase/Tfp pilus assembly protein PilF